MLKRLLFIITTTLLSFNTIDAQISYYIFEYKDLGFFNQDSTYGGFNNKIGYLKVKITNYTYDKKTQILSFSGNVADYLTDETFCGIFAFSGKTARKVKKLNIFEQYKVDCLGNFIISLKVEPDLKLFFWFYGCSLLECSIDPKKL